jgi:hypothetical protein
LASKQLLATACPLGLTYLLNYGQWEVLTLFVVALGPAEMVAWAILGYLWSILKYISDGGGVLLASSPGTGKSTLAYFCASFATVLNPAVRLIDISCNSLDVVAVCNEGKLLAFK